MLDGACGTLRECAPENIDSSNGFDVTINVCDVSLCNDECDDCGQCIDATTSLMPTTTEEATTTTTTPPPPECEYSGQTFEYPGSCRDYFLCQEDGNAVVFNCCPYVYNPYQDSCVPEEVGGDLCGEDDVCSGAPNLNRGTSLYLVVMITLTIPLIS